jgi:hypothetical protein
LDGLKQHFQGLRASPDKRPFSGPLGGSPPLEAPLAKAVTSPFPLGADNKMCFENHKHADYTLFKKAFVFQSYHKGKGMLKKTDLFLWMLEFCRPILVSTRVSKTQNSRWGVNIKLGGKLGSGGAVAPPLAYSKLRPCPALTF